MYKSKEKELLQSLHISTRLPPPQNKISFKINKILTDLLVTEVELWQFSVFLNSSTCSFQYRSRNPEWIHPAKGTRSLYSTCQTDRCIRSRSPDSTLKKIKITAIYYITYSNCVCTMENIIRSHNSVYYCWLSNLKNWTLQY